MNEIIVRLPKIPELPKLHVLKKIKLPKLKKLEVDKGRGQILSAFNTNIRNTTIGIQSLKINALFAKGEKERVEIEQKPLSAGRGGVHYGKTSSMGMMAEGAVKQTRSKKKEHVPYKPTPQLHPIRGLWDISQHGIPGYEGD